MNESKKLDIIFYISVISLVLISAFNFPIIFFDSLLAKFYAIVSFFGVIYLIALVFTVYFKSSMTKVFFVSLLLTILGIVLHAFIEWNESSFMRYFTIPALFIYILASSIYITSIAMAKKSKVSFHNGRIDIN